MQRLFKEFKSLVLTVCAVILMLLILVISLLAPHPKDKSPDKSISSAISSTKSQSAIEYADMPIDLASLKKRNPDVCGWITVPGTLVDYPILQSSKSDSNDYYLTHTIDRKENINGSIYIQRQNSNDFKDPNTLIYGHNMRNGSMFGSLHRFKDKTFFESNEYIYIYTEGRKKTYRIFSAYKTGSAHILNKYDFSTKEGREQYIADSLNPKNKINNVRDGVKVTEKDKIVTLSTCINDKRYRYIVLGVLVSDQPTKPYQPTESVNSK